VPSVDQVIRIGADAPEFRGLLILPYAVVAQEIKADGPRDFVKSFVSRAGLQRRNRPR
jgi:hypothetical protein